MASAIRYRTGLDGSTGKVLTGYPHLVRSLETIWSTRIDQRVMRLAFGSDLRGLLGEDVTPALALLLYNELAAAVHRWEPEYRVDELQLVTLTEGGALGLRHGGLYFPEGRFGNFDLAIPMAARPSRFALGGLI